MRVYLKAFGLITPGPVIFHMSFDIFQLPDKIAQLLESLERLWRWERILTPTLVKDSSSFAQYKILVHFQNRIRD